MVHLSVVIPVLNEESIVSELVGRVRKEILSLTNDYEIIIIDDGSKDKTLVNLKKICEMDSKIKTIKFSRNFGQQTSHACLQKKQPRRSSSAQPRNTRDLQESHHLASKSCVIPML